MKLKAQCSINYLKAVTSCSQGIMSLHMLKLIKVLIGSLVDYGAPLLYNSPPSALNHLKVCLNAAVRLAKGLPK